MGKFILRSKAVFTGLEDFPRPAAIAVVDKKIQAVLPWDFQRDKDYADWPLYDYGEKNDHVFFSGCTYPSFFRSH